MAPGIPWDGEEPLVADWGKEYADRVRTPGPRELDHAPAAVQSYVRSRLAADVEPWGPGAPGIPVNEASCGPFGMNLMDQRQAVGPLGRAPKGAL